MVYTQPKQVVQIECIQNYIMNIQTFVHTSRILKMWSRTELDLNNIPNLSVQYSEKRVRNVEQRVRNVEQRVQIQGLRIQILGTVSRAQ